MTSVRYVISGMRWHSEHKRLARLRALYWIVIRKHETEICCICGGPVGVVWWCHDQAVWNRINGREGGSLCISCFDERARSTACWLEWAPLNLQHLDCPHRGGAQP